MKFLKPIEVQAGISDGDPTNPLGQAGYLLSSDGSNVNWVSPGGLSAETAEAIVQPIKANGALSKGDPVYIVGFQNGQNTNIVAKADSSDVAKMPVVGLVDDDYANNAFGTMTAFGSFNGNFDTTGGTENWAIGDIIFVKPGGGLTNVKPTGTDLIQNIAIVSRVQQNTGELEVIALGRTNDVPNLPEGRLFVGTAANTSLASDVIYVDDTNDRVGIGTASPAHKLTVNAPNDTTAVGIDFPSAHFDFSANSTSGYTTLFNMDDTGLDIGHNAGSRSLNLKTNNSDRLTILGGGNVGIGTTNPNYKLEVNGTLGVNRTDGIIFAGGAAAGLGNKITSDTLNNFIFSTSLPSVPYTTTPKMTILNGGNVGIGTTQPSVELQVGNFGGTETPEIIVAGGTTSQIQLNTTNATGSFAQVGFGGTQFATSNTAGKIRYTHTSQVTPTLDVMSFRVNYSDRMVINGSGNVGIGTTNPGGYKLAVAGSTAIGENFQVSDGLGGDRTLDINAPNGAFRIGDIDGITDEAHIEGDGEYIKIFNGGSLTLITDSNQNVGIGAPNPNAKLEVNGDIALSGNNKLYSEADVLTLMSGGTGGTYLVVDDASGNVGVGTTSPNTKLEVAGSTRITGTGLDVGYGNNGTNYVQVGFGRTTNGFAYFDLIGDSTYSDYGFRILRNNGGPNADTDIIHRGTGDLDLKTIDAGDIGLHTASIQRMIVKSGGDVGIGTTSPFSKLHVNGGVKLGNDTASPSANKVGTFRYRTSGNNSYVDMCMQTGASTYAWVNIVTNSW